jgi:hypothetical protein
VSRRAALLLAPLIAACSVDAGPRCGGTGAQPMTVVELYFGRDGVSDTAWSSFLGNVVTPRFPDGLTVLDGRGQWRDPSGGQISREAASVVVIAVDRAAFERIRVDQVADAYKAMFGQRSVGRIVSERCGAFN